MIKRGLSIFAALTQLIVFTNVDATTFHNFLPGGKNYIDIQNIEVLNNVLYLKNPVKVLPNQAYTLSMPNDDMLGYGMYIIVEGIDTYIDDSDPFSECQKTDDFIICTFTTSEMEESLNLTIYGDSMNQYFEYFGIQNIQLEEGQNRTTYEEYIDPYIDSTVPLFSGSGAYITSYDSTTTIEDIIDAHIAATDEVDGDLSDQIVIISDTYTANKNLIGEYLVELSVSDSSNNVAYFDLYVFVKDEIDPYINCQEDIYLNINDQLDLTDIVNQYIHYGDEYDLSPTISIITDDYTENMEKLGTYQISVKVEDQSGNSTRKDVNIHVKDYDSPVMVSDTVYELNVDDKTTVDTIIENIIATDNYDNDVLIEVIGDGYTNNMSFLGTYFIDIVLRDSSNNERYVTLEIHVNDNTNPEIVGPLSIGISYEDLMTITDIKNLFTVNDNNSQLTINDLIVLEDTYSNKISKTGDYFIIFGATDESGNTVQHRLDINVYDDVKPIILIDGYIIVVDQNTTFTPSDMMKLLSLSDDLDEASYEIEILKNEYIGHEDVVGDYHYKIKIITENGDELIKDFVISVEETTSETSNVRHYILFGSTFILMIGIFIYIKRK